ncbi:MAG TPA: AMP-binding protein [Burkholderiaceae bacterium]|jgi:fatty-acyl-CoA synthase|nr:AMP-binding protein [Burkholderiaceae bacterium]
MDGLKTTRPVRVVKTIADIEAIESLPYDHWVTAHNLHDLLGATALHGAQRPALTVLRSPDPHDVGGHWTHGELLYEARRSANLFRALGLGPAGGVAAFLMPTLPELPALLLGAQIAGVAGSLNYLLKPEAIADLLNAMRATVLVVPARALDAACWEAARAVRERVPTLRHVLVAGGGRPCAAADLAPLGGIDAAAELRAHDGARLAFELTAGRDTVCALFHTGGTTGRPKLVRLTHGNQIHAAFGFAQVFGYDENDVVIDGLPWFHVGGTMTVGLAPLAAGGHLIVPSPYALRPPAVIEGYWRLVKHFRATVVGGVPTSIAALANAWRPGDDASTVRMAMTGGAVLPRAVGERFEAITGIRIYETYGMTETAAAIAFNPGRGEPRAGSVGFRAPYSRTRIVRFESGQPVPCAPLETGLVQVRGPQVFPGYVNAAHNDGVLDEEGWLTTGDLGYLTEDERLVLTGREKDLIIRSGHNIDPAAIEDVANRFVGVQISAAVGMPDAHAGEVPILFVVPQPGAAIDLEALQRYLQASVHEPPARPKCVLLLDALPVTAVGKVFKPKLRELAIEEKVRQEVQRHCGSAASAQVQVTVDAQRRTVVDVAVRDADPQALTALARALEPLAQTYCVRPLP